jgi:hypothetical protein
MSVAKGVLMVTVSQGDAEQVPWMRSTLIWDALQGANHSHSPAMTRICNAAGRPKRGAARHEGLCSTLPHSPKLPLPRSHHPHTQRAIGDGMR